MSYVSILLFESRLVVSVAIEVLISEIFGKKKKKL